jgi:HSP90 family molecular chaperone
MLAKKTLELNPNHSVMKKMLSQLKENGGSMDPNTEDLAKVMYNMALLNSGFNIDKPNDFTTPL